MSAEAPHGATPAPKLVGDRGEAAKGAEAPPERPPEAEGDFGEAAPAGVLPGEVGENLPERLGDVGDGFGFGLEAMLLRLAAAHNILSSLRCDS